MNSETEVNSVQTASALPDSVSEHHRHENEHIVDPRMRRALILTSTLKPADTVYKLKRSQLEIRRSDYLTSVQRWSKGGLGAWDDVYLVDNSPDILSEQWSEFVEQIHRCSDGKIQAIHVDVRPDPTAILLQKGREEAKLLDAAVSRLADMGVTYFSKVTGRLFVSNADRVILPSQHEGISAAISNRLNLSDTRFFAMPLAEWSAHFTGMDEDVDEPSGIMLEHVFAQRTMRAVGQGSRFVSMPRLPLYAGSSGSMDIDYGSFKGRTKRMLHELLRLPYQRYSVTL
jgi:hypothetical protein